MDKVADTIWYTTVHIVTLFNICCLVENRPIKRLTIFQNLKNIFTDNMKNYQHNAGTLSIRWSNSVTAFILLRAWAWKTNFVKSTASSTLPVLIYFDNYIRNISHRIVLFFPVFFFIFFLFPMQWSLSGGCLLLAWRESPLQQHSRWFFNMASRDTQSNTVYVSYRAKTRPFGINKVNSC